MTINRNAAGAAGSVAPRASGGWRIASVVLATIVALFGLVLAGGGIWLIILGGSWYYGLAGIGLLVTAFLIVKQSMSALYFYLIVWALTFAWAFWEVGLNFWAQVPRLVAPTVILVLILAILPALRPKRT